MTARDAEAPWIMRMVMTRLVAVKSIVALTGGSSPRRSRTGRHDDQALPSPRRWPWRTRAENTVLASPWCSASGSCAVTEHTCPRCGSRKADWMTATAPNPVFSVQPPIRTVNGLFCSRSCSVGAASACQCSAQILKRFGSPPRRKQPSSRSASAPPRPTLDCAGLRHRDELCFCSA